MPVKIGINGLGRTGRTALRAALQNKEVEVVALNSRADTRTVAHLLKYDSVYGRYPGEIRYTEDSLIINGRKIPYFRSSDPLNIPWRDYGVEVAIESTGVFKTREEAFKHIKAGAERVLVSAPMSDPDITLVLGINDDKYDPRKHKVVSMASCTTNAAVPVLKVINDEFGIIKAFLTTVHAYTGNQRLVDKSHKDLRRARAAAMNIIPTSTGASKAIVQVLPELRDKIDAVAIRVPIIDGSLIDLSIEVSRDVSANEVNNVLKRAAEGNLKGILEYTEDPIVSSDIIGNSSLSIIDATLTKVIGGNLVKVFAWYDNEWGYSCKLIELTAKILSRR
ncbi:type I glyceraldehyde-3-phosphate dehydrogenase [Candidatus Geothermarchaeota archaeon]|nr:MAG: type I glyceraldehyde-3-phosphate dehydrogenase [Candidatus Geothermarchaeota archaeon]